MMRHAAMLEQALLALGAADEYDAVARAIADGARQLADAVLATLAAPAWDGAGLVVTASGGLTDASADDAGIDLLPVYTFSLATERVGDETPPLLRLHGDHLTAEPPTELIARFAPHARVALARAQRFDAMARLASTDPLTGLPNLRGLQDALARAADLANAEQRPLALLIIDLDDFRRYNTLWGHLVGDAALQAFARAIRSAARPRDIVARVGGEEFVMLLPDADEAEACVVAAQIHEAIALGSGGLPSAFTASVGIGVFPTDVPDALSLYAVADTAMTMAKRAGKNRSFHFETMAKALR